MLHKIDIDRIAQDARLKNEREEINKSCAAERKTIAQKYASIIHNQKNKAYADLNEELAFRGYEKVSFASFINYDIASAK